MSMQSLIIFLRLTIETSKTDIKILTHTNIGLKRLVIIGYQILTNKDNH